MHRPDLSPYDADDQSLAPLKAVGWLDRGHEYPTGSIDPAFIGRLKELLASPFQPFAAFGLHECTLCQFDGPKGSANLYVPGDGVVFVMPELALHFMAAHHYRPPGAFQAAVMACPPMQSMAYKRALLANGGRSLVRR